LLASLGSKGKNSNSLACLRNACSHSAETYCSARRYPGVVCCASVCCHQTSALLAVHNVMSSTYQAQHATSVHRHLERPRHALRWNNRWNAICRLHARPTFCSHLPWRSRSCSASTMASGPGSSYTWKAAWQTGTQSQQRCARDMTANHARRHTGMLCQHALYAFEGGRSQSAHRPWKSVDGSR
jgi:hypothetical protein